MRSLSESPPISANQIGGSDPKNPEENFRPGLVGDVCRSIWPDKTDLVVADIGGKTDRAARDWMSGKVPIPSVLLAAINQALTRRPKL